VTDIEINDAFSNVVMYLAVKNTLPFEFKIPSDASELSKFDQVYAE
jgi:antitoxin component of RelBE/YafQ-DinJ toxin-antitoxin module